MQSDLILDILGNETRRKILGFLSEEPMYFNQLSRKIGVGQQAVLRHLQALQDSGMINSFGEKSELGAPDRKYFRVNTSFVLTISLSEDNFSINNQKIVESRQKESNKYYERFDSTPKDTGRALPHLQEVLAAAEEEMSALEDRLNDLRALRQLILQRLHEMGNDTFDDFERKVLYRIVEESPRSLAELSNMLNERRRDLKRTITSMRNKLDNDSAKVLFKDLK